MKRIVFVIAALVLSAPAWAGANDEYACMRDGPGSRACEWAQFQNERQNEQRQEQMERAREAQRCQFTRCY